MRRYYVGLDVHSKDSVYAIQDELGALIGEGSVPTTPEGLLGLRQRYVLPEGTTVGLETGTVAFYVARALQRRVTSRADLPETLVSSECFKESRWKRQVAATER